MAAESAKPVYDSFLVGLTRYFLCTGIFLITQDPLSLVKNRVESSCIYQEAICHRYLTFQPKYVIGCTTCSPCVSTAGQMALINLNQPGPQARETFKSLLFVCKTTHHEAAPTFFGRLHYIRRAPIRLREYVPSSASNGGSQARLPPPPRVEIGNLPSVQQVAC